MKFKVGDVVKCICGISEYNGGPKEGETFIVTSADENYIGFALERLIGAEYSEQTKAGNYANWGNSNFILAIPEINEQKLKKVLKLND